MFTERFEQEVGEPRPGTPAGGGNESCISLRTESAQGQDTSVLKLGHGTVKRAREVGARRRQGLEGLGKGETWVLVQELLAPWTGPLRCKEGTKVLKK